MFKGSYEWEVVHPSSYITGLSFILLKNQASRKQGTDSIFLKLEVALKIIFVSYYKDSVGASGPT